MNIRLDYFYFQPNIIIHSAAERRPDVVERQEEETHRLNIEATRFISEAAGEAVR